MARMNVQETIGMVAELRQRVLERQRFHGYSGLARAAGGTWALLLSGVARWAGWGEKEQALLTVWGVVFCGAVAMNYGALVWWRLTGRGKNLGPALEPLPMFWVGGVLTWALAQAGVPDLLPGMWLGLLGLTQFTAKYALPWRIRWVGWFYLTMSTIVLLGGDWAWRDPLVLGGMFFFGEWTGGFILHEETRKAGRLEAGTCVFTNDDEN